MVVLALLVAAAAASILYVLGIAATLRHRAMPRAVASDPSFPPLSLLKPVKGVEEAMEENLRTFFRQEYPGEFEIVFASFDEDDPGIALARRVAREYPHVPVRFVRSDPNFGPNPKVANLAGALAAACFEHVLQSDANVRIRPGYLRDIVTEYQAEGASLLTSMVVGRGEASIPAAMENLQLSAFIGPAMCAALHLGGVRCVVGKSMLFRKSELASLGGLEQVRDILCEDFILGRRYAEEGRTVILSRITVENINERISLRQFVSRHARWLKMRVVIHLVAFIADLFANPTALLLAAYVASGFEGRLGLLLAAGIVAKIAGDAFLVRTTRGEPMRLRYLLIAPFKDLLMVFVWVHACFSRSVVWRGVRLRFGKDSRILSDVSSAPLAEAVDVVDVG